MAVYVDDAIWHWQGRKWCHLLADSEEELHRFAFSLGIYRSSYQGPPRTSKPHYDLTAWERAAALSPTGCFTWRPPGRGSGCWRRRNSWRRNRPRQYFAGTYVPIRLGAMI